MEQIKGVFIVRDNDMDGTILGAYETDDLNACKNALDYARNVDSELDTLSTLEVVCSKRHIKLKKVEYADYCF